MGVGVTIFVCDGVGVGVPDAVVDEVADGDELVWLGDDVELDAADALAPVL